MSRVVIQAGHCHRRTGSVGTRSRDGYTEQQFSWAVANRAVSLLRDDGHAALVIEADVPSGTYRGDAFVAIHADGNNSPSVGGASVGHRTPEGNSLADAWKGAYAELGWSHGFRRDNYTAALGGYYGVKRAVEQGNRRACILEFGFLTNPTEAAILRSPAGQARAAESVRRAVNAVLGTPNRQPSEEDDMDPRALVVLTYNAILGRNPESLETIAKGAAFITGHKGGEREGQNAYVAHIANSPEAKARHS